MIFTRAFHSVAGGRRSEGIAFQRILFLIEARGNTESGNKLKKKVYFQND